MRCYFTGDECDCGNGDLDDECPHDDMVHEPELLLAVAALNDKGDQCQPTICAA